MKKLDFRKISLLLIGFLFLVACEGTFVPDPTDPRLPKYTEEGNNVAGAIVNGEIWKSVVTVGFMYVGDDPYINICQQRDSITIHFKGNTNGKNASIEFHLKGLNISDFEDLVSLQGKKIQLDGVKNTGYYYNGYHKINYEKKGIGQLYIKNVKIEGRDSPIVTLSGTFGFTVTNADGKKIKVSYGRFDYIFSEGNTLIIDE